MEIKNKQIYLRYKGKLFLSNKYWKEYIKKYRIKVKQDSDITKLLEKGDIVYFDDSGMPFEILVSPNEKYDLNAFYLVSDISNDYEDMECSIKYMRKHLVGVITNEQVKSHTFWLNKEGK